MQPSTSRVWGVFFAQMHSRGTSQLGGWETCVSLALSFFLSYSKLLVIYGWSWSFAQMHARTNLVLHIRQWYHSRHDSRVAMSHVSGGFRCRIRVADKLACPTDCRKFEMLSYRSKIVMAIVCWSRERWSKAKPGPRSSTAREQERYHALTVATHPFSPVHQTIVLPSANKFDLSQDSTSAESTIRIWWRESYSMFIKYVWSILTRRGYNPIVQWPRTLPACRISLHIAILSLLGSSHTSKSPLSVKEKL